MKQQPEWFFAYMGAMMAGGVAAGIYVTNGPEACHVRYVHTCIYMPWWW